MKTYNKSVLLFSISVALALLSNNSYSKVETIDVAANAVQASSPAVQPSPDMENHTSPADPETMEMQNKQTLIMLENTIEEEKLRQQFSGLRSELQKLRWEKELLEEKLSLAQLKRDTVAEEENTKHAEILKKLKNENDVLAQKLSIAHSKYELARHESKKQSEEALATLRSEKSQLQEQLDIEKLKRDNAQQKDKLAYDDKIQALTREKTLLNEKLDLQNSKRTEELRDAVIEFEDKLTALSRDATLSKAKADTLKSKLMIQNNEARLKIVGLESEIQRLEMEKKRKAYIDAQPVYLEDPLKKDGTLVISDRRILLNGPIRQGTADYVTSRINYYNNKDKKYPIFIVIDDSPGGSVMQGYRIVKAMEGSEAPVYVVVKSFAASMAAGITAMAEKSYAYPNAVIIHHQISQFFFFRSMNLTQQKEMHQESQEWWKRLATPVAKKMGISTKEFIERMYEKNSDGDWSEFGTEAKELKWVDHIVTSIQETSQLKDPNEDERKFLGKISFKVDEDGTSKAYLPRLSPKDFYYLYNPDGYYQIHQ
ncbi:MAG: ATP-dependent Clp protease proteolytic subunit (EC [uncultured Thiotrichaceae bacterium]|uniref:ATP-dependent Clp protease proteolytic subunit (EC) n=1 Tax=uncultured Thiotrichaceae bacterium TaxID=298394 RepID=A0A6S6SRI3_9GAMM|nr:MAG: ATP-dependent Clp protease proteolytic subunit (EC [uncultured Thiotrichaceae bacterium]